MASYRPLWYYAAASLPKERILILSSKLFKKRLFHENPLQQLMVDMLINNSCIEERRCLGRVFSERTYAGRLFLFLKRGAEDQADLLYPGVQGFCAESIEEKLPIEPVFAIINSFYYNHTIKERKHLILQEALLINEVRKWAWDKHVVFVDTPIEAINRIRVYTGKIRAQLMDISSFCQVLNNYKPAALNPYADDVLSEHVVRSRSLFIIGGIVDKERPQKNATIRLLDKILKECRTDIPQYRIEIDGMYQPVPHRLNKIVEILLLIIYEGMSLRNAIIKAMSNRDIAWLLYLLVSRGESRDRITGFLHDIEKIKGKKLADYVIKKALKMAGIES